MSEFNYKDNRWFSFGIIILCYVIAVIVGIKVFSEIDGALWNRLLFADLAATLVIWLLSLMFQNASIYDPYWSVQPVVILTLLLMKYNRYDIGSVLLYAVIAYWGIRLTVNWAYTFQGLRNQDWRYDQLKEQTGRMFQLVNLLGIQLMPTLIVYLCILPAAYYMELVDTFNIKIVIGLIISTAAATLQMISDNQMHKFRKSNPDKKKIIRNGLWKYSRHPNYLGEILMWWGVYLTMVGIHHDKWYLCIGALINTFLFLLISIPMAEKRLSGYKEGYEEYKKETRKLLPLPKNIWNT